MTLASDNTRENEYNFRKESIYQCLNPAKGYTIWASQEETMICSWDSYLGPKTISLKTDGLYHITLSSFTIKQDYFKLIAGLNTYNEEKILPSYRQDISFIYPEADLKGSLEGESLFIDDDMGNFQITNLAILEEEAYKKGAKRVFLPLKNYQEGLGAAATIDIQAYTTFEKLKGLDYVDLGGSINFKTGDFDGCLLKELKDQNLNTPNPRCTINWEDPTHPFSGLLQNAQEVTNEFSGFFLRNEKDHVIGGLLVSKPENPIIPHIYVNAFYMGGSVRNKGFGKIIMKKLEEYARSIQINHILLGTSDHQAPWFYEKMGYVRLSTIPKAQRDKAGKFISHHNYGKDLSKDNSRYVKETL